VFNEYDTDSLRRARVSSSNLSRMINSDGFRLNLQETRSKDCTFLVKGSIVFKGIQLLLLVIIVIVTTVTTYLLRPIYMKFKLEVVAGFCAARPV
jgi:hypothetical protein